MTVAPAPDLPSAILVDVDGTLASRLDGGRGPFEWHRVGEDAPVAAVIATVRALHAAGHTVIVMSGRDEVSRVQTESWLTHHLGVPYVDLLMRSVGDNRPDWQVKGELFERHVRDRYAVLLVLDDRRSVVRMWRDRFGLVCLQVADGDF